MPKHSAPLLLGQGVGQQLGLVVTGAGLQVPGYFFYCTLYLYFKP